MHCPTVPNADMISCLTHWVRVTHICVSNLTIVGSDNGLPPCQRQAIICTNAGLLIGPLGTNFNEILIEIHTFSFKKMHSKMSSAKWRPFYLGLNVLNSSPCQPHTPMPHAVNIGVAGDMMMNGASAPATKIFRFQHQKIYMWYLKVFFLGYQIPRNHDVKIPTRAALL